jgi:hypothetical protein
MRTAEIPAKDWSRTLDEFSANHEGSLISVELFAPALGAQSEIHDLPLLGLSIESAGDSTIMIAAGRSPEAQITPSRSNPPKAQRRSYVCNRSA